MSPDQQGPIPPQIIHPQDPQQPQQPVQPSNGTYPVMPAVPAVPNNGHSGHNPYDFIINSNTPKQKLFNFNSGSFVARVAVVVGGLVVLLTLVALAIAFFAPKSNTDGLKAIVQRQQEILRIVGLVDTTVTDQDIRNLVANTDASILSSKIQMTSYLTKRKVTLDPATLALARDTSVDTLLKNAAQAGTYNTTAVDTLASQLTKYESVLRSTYKETSNKQTKQLLQDCFASADKLLEQAKAVKI